jgi:hypothetical protein
MTPHVKLRCFRKAAELRRAADGDRASIGTRLLAGAVAVLLTVSKALRQMRACYMPGANPNPNPPAVGHSHLYPQ